MSKYLTEFDEIRAALGRVRLDEECMVYRNGMLLENQEAYNKIQKLLRSPEMSDAHKALYDMDVENLSPEELDKVNRLFDLAVRNGYVDNSFQEEIDKSENPDAVVADEEPEKAQQLQQLQQAVQEPERSVPIPCWTVLYSATKDGETKCGECYSNAISVQAAKADCLAKLERFGYANIAVLAIEAGDVDAAGPRPDGTFRTNVMPKAPAAEEKPVQDGAEEDQLNEMQLPDTSESTSKNPYAAGMEMLGEEGEDDEDGAADDTGGDEGDAGGDMGGGDDDAGDDAGAGGDDAGDIGSNEGGDDIGGDEGDAGDDAGEDDAGDEGDAGEDEDGDEGGDELSDEDKTRFKDEYKTMFRDVMIACEFTDKSFIDLTIPEKVLFFSTINVKWGGKPDPTKFMTEEEQDQLESVVVSKEE